jgi:hypothetical protein
LSTLVAVTGSPNEQVWRLVSLGQRLLASRGAVSSLVRRGAFAYSTRLWVEDGDGFELAIEQVSCVIHAHDVVCC